MRLMVLLLLISLGANFILYKDLDISHRRTARYEKLVKDIYRENGK